jgi:hypothetical protein
MPLPDSLLVLLLTGAKLFELYDPGLIPDPPWNNLPGVFPVIGFDDRPPAVSTIVAAPFEKMEVASGVDLLDDGIAVAGIMRGFDKIAFHGLPFLDHG